MSQQIAIHENYSVEKLNSLALRGKARAYIEAYGIADVLSSIQFASDHKLPLIPIGDGTNLILGETVAACLIRYQADCFNKISESHQSVTLKVDAGMNWHKLVMETIQQGWYGLENLALIPGTVGAAPVQNIGAYGVEIEQFIRQVEGVILVDCELGSCGDVCQIDVSECQFDYRNSRFKQGLDSIFLITSVTLELQKQFEPVLGYPALQDYFETKIRDQELTAIEVANAVIDIRQSKLPDPAVLPNAGSFFKNPIVSHLQGDQLKALYPKLPMYEIADGKLKLAAGWLIEACGFKGKVFGSLGLHDQQALVMVNYQKQAVGAKEVLALAQLIQESVREKFDVALEIEPRMYGT